MKDRKFISDRLRFYPADFTDHSFVKGDNGKSGWSKRMKTTGSTSDFTGSQKTDDTFLPAGYIITALHQSFFNKSHPVARISGPEQWNILPETKPMTPPDQRSPDFI